MIAVLKRQLYYYKGNSTGKAPAAAVLGSGPFEDVHGIAGHLLGVMDIGLQGGLGVGVSKALMHILDVRASLDPHGCMGVAEHVIVEVYSKIVMDHAGAYLKESAMR